MLRPKGIDVMAPGNVLPVLSSAIRSANLNLGAESTCAKDT